jgi:chemotaxis regulatin CheY-phosphate phosphatase CheZ
MLPVDTTDRLHVVIDRAARAAAAAFKDAEDAVPAEQREVFERLAMRADRTVRLETYAFLNDHELA